MSMQSGLVRYDAMCLAIAECHGVDEAKNIRDKARAIEVYAQQAKNKEAERKAAEIRIRAERKAGALLKEMKASGKRQPQGGDKKSKSPRTILIQKGGPANSQHAPALKDMGITPDQSSKWQQLANVPEEEFERAVKGDGPKPTTEGIINANTLSKTPTPRIDPTALWLWGRLCDFEKNELFNRDMHVLISGMTESMQDDCLRILPKLMRWIEGARNESGNNRAA